MKNEEKALLPIFYIYVYLDPRKPGKFQYPGSSASFLFEPIYVGKGHGGRIGNADGSYLKNKVNKIRKEGFEVIMFKLSENLTEREAFNDEIIHITAIGRKRNPTGISLGPLTNLTDGGEGRSGLFVSKEQRKRYSIMFSGEGNPNSGKTLIHNFIKQIWVYEKDIHLHNGFIKGMLPENKDRLRNRKSQPKKICITDGSITKRIEEKDLKDYPRFYKGIDDEQKRQRSINSTKENNPIYNKMLCNDGKLEFFLTQEEKSKRPEIKIGKIETTYFYTNGIKTIKIKEKDSIKFPNYHKGISSETKQKLTSDVSGENNPCYGKKLYNNGYKNKYIKEDELYLFPDFIYIGSIKKGKLKQVLTTGNE